MKRLLFFTVVSMVVGVLGCKNDNSESNGSQKQEPLQDLVVKELIDTVHFDKSIDDSCYISFKVDAPISGSQILVDSVMAFLNNQLYVMFGSYLPFDTEAISPEDMMTKDGGRLLSNYTEKFKEPLKEPCGYWYKCIELKLEAQTEKYVTYGLKVFGDNGMHSSSEKFYFTFDKSDGHQVKDLVSQKNITRFSKENQEYEFDPELALIDNYCGLLDDKIVLVYPYYHGTTELTETIPCSEFFPYLTPEVQELVGKNAQN